MHSSMNELGLRTGTLAVASAATLLVLIDYTTALTTTVDTAAGLHASPSWQTWALSAMGLGLATALLTAGALADELGRRRTLLVSVVALGVATAAAGAAPSIAGFVGARVLQGVAGAGVLASSLGLIGHAFPDGTARTRATGVWGAMIGAGIAAGPLVAGWLAALGDWRLAYWAETVAALPLLIAATHVGESSSAVRRAIDVPGGLTLTAGTTALTASFVAARQGWTGTVTLVLLGAGVALLATFIAVERHQEAPMLDLGLLRSRAFVASLIGALVTGLALIAPMSYAPTFMQRALHLSVLASAGILAVWSGTSAIVAWHARRLPTRFGAPSRLSAGLVFCTAGLLTLSWLSADATWLDLVPGLLVTGVGSGIGNAALARLAVASVPADRTGMGSGANNTARYLGGSAGVALVVAVAAGADGGTDTGALVHGWNTAALVSAILCAAGAAIVFFCREPRAAPAADRAQRRRSRTTV